MKKYIKILIALTISFILIMLYARFIGTSGLKINEYKVINSDINDNYNGLKIIQISDLHYNSTINQNSLKKIIKEINNLNPDIVVLTGDIIDGRIEYNKDELINELKNIKAKLGKYAISGNHDVPSEDYYDIIENSDFINLDNDYQLIYNDNEPIIISGINSNINDTTDINIKVKKFNDFITSEENNAIYSILLIHEPDFVDQLNLDNYNLILSGHSHGGQIRLPIIGKIYTPNGAKKYYNGHYKIKNTDLYVSTGLGTSTIKMRLFNKPSINFYRIAKK